MGNNRRGEGFRGKKPFGHQGHDNRQSYGTSRKVSFRPKKGSYYSSKDKGALLAAVFDEDDRMGEEPGPSHSNSRYPTYSRGRGKGRGNRGSFRGGRPGTIDGDRARKMGLPVGRDKDDGGVQWHKVTIPHGKKCGKDWLMQNLQQCGTPFVPFHFHTESHSSVFYVNDRLQANSLRALSRQIDQPSGHKLVIITSPSSEPSSSLTEENTKLLEECLGRRYNADTKMLNLSNLFKDDVLSAQGVYFALNRPTIAMAVMDIIKTSAPQLEILDLSSNRIFSMKAYRKLHEVAPCLNRLNLGSNQLKIEADLDDLKKLQLVELHMDGNPICNKYDDSAEYISMVRKRFPRLLTLDGHELPPAIGFDLDVKSALPSIKGNFFPNDNIRDLVCRFLDQYYSLYDTNRQALLEAYHDQVIFSMCPFYSKLASSYPHKLNDYFSDGRNMSRVDQQRRQKALKVGRLSVVALLDSMPATQHDPSSYVVDVNYFNEANGILSFTVLGLFKETVTKHNPIRSFSRTFVTQAQGSGIVIVNEEFMITNPVSDQLKRAFQVPAPTPSSSPVTTSSAALTPELQQEMVKRFCMDSRMNPEWSQKCLTENAWDYEKSGKMFQDLHAQGRIPPEAFIGSP
ncbi:hypothetical protein CAPTEDRAFT_166114 [Capitella teleta]|uniref:NTF2 domain-containing protein n=1 Tax=Capitella teleta TaxID=283909 RepID=R7V826_CAPTE|nr:hypothetical protein CAPTEDRAFT_166114 [Capitella teleta]|eukprot:ELU14652.1 hypothetical protein CAPTEDRAFT_166114 [Capitella teleta]